MPPSDSPAPELVEDGVRFIISDQSAVDRHNTRILIRKSDKGAGLDIGPMLANPILLDEHTERALGVWEDLKFEGDQFKGRAVFAPGDDFAQAKRAFLVWRVERAKAKGTQDRGGMASLGFIPKLDLVYPDGRHFVIPEAEAVEASIVNVGSNPAALAEARAAGVDLGPVLDVYERALAEAGYTVKAPEPPADPKDLKIRALEAEVEKLRQALDPPRGLVASQIDPEAFARHVAQAVQAERGALINEITTRLGI